MFCLVIYSPWARSQGAGAVAGSEDSSLTQLNEPFSSFINQSIAQGVEWVTPYLDTVQFSFLLSINLFPYMSLAKGGGGLSDDPSLIQLRSTFFCFYSIIPLQASIQVGSTFRFCYPFFYSSMGPLVKWFWWLSSYLVGVHFSFLSSIDLFRYKPLAGWWEGSDDFSDECLHV